MTQHGFFKNNEPQYEVWDAFDNRLPENVDRPKDKSFKDFVLNFARGQIQPIVVCRLGKKFILAAGRKRLMAARELQIPIEVKLVDVRNEQDIIAIRISENEFRSANEAADVLAMRNALFSGRTYEEVASFLPGMSVNGIKKMDKDWANVPLEIMTAAADGNVSVAAAKEIGKMKAKSAVKRIVKKLQEKGKLSLADVKEERQAVRAEAIGSMKWLNEEQVGRSTFARMELEQVYTLLKNQDFEGAIIAVENLLS